MVTRWVREEGEREVLRCEGDGDELANGWYFLWRKDDEGEGILGSKSPH